MEQANKSPFLKEEVLGNLFQTTFKIPHYQRPYKWRKEHVIQLLDDLYENIYLKKNAIYRVGSIIIHDDKTHNNIVDGQQRLTTLSLIFHYLKEQNVLLQNENYKHEISKNNIKYNYQLIENWFLSKSFSASEKQDYLDKIKKGCQFVIITVYQQDEAFQLFDSQNSRGKPLEPYDLLKAFHLREMENDAHTEAEIEKYAVQWEDYLLKNDKPLKSIFENHLFRIRKWAKREKKYLFSKNDISEFKGISLYKGNKYTYEIIYRLLDGAIQNAQKDKMLRNFNIS
ncbi:Protein of unknown function DUF262 [Epilithonimonas bovis DSM 19482]|uniref:Uncharacterized protein n=1 Tax=Epilithonimonas bovis DSM 19482 TaxID=1121284 RepID=A0A1U7PV05_9FLAO|nr:DUF262 domain-containing protein [Epilithonimonas bovis]SIT95598.1 Protein of unknown function DUF262 [Epilithonimonas bovis DSM 19482]